MIKKCQATTFFMHRFGRRDDTVNDAACPPRLWEFNLHANWSPAFVGHTMNLYMELRFFILPLKTQGSGSTPPHRGYPNSRETLPGSSFHKRFLPGEKARIPAGIDTPKVVPRDLLPHRIWLWWKGFTESLPGYLSIGDKIYGDQTTTERKLITPKVHLSELGLILELWLPCISWKLADTSRSKLAVSYHIRAHICIWADFACHGTLDEKV